MALIWTSFLLVTRCDIGCRCYKVVTTRMSKSFQRKNIKHLLKPLKLILLLPAMPVEFTNQHLWQLVGVQQSNTPLGGRYSNHQRKLLRDASQHDNNCFCYGVQLTVQQNGLLIMALHAIEATWPNSFGCYWCNWSKARFSYQRILRAYG